MARPRIKDAPETITSTEPLAVVPLLVLLPPDAGGATRAVEGDAFHGGWPGLLLQDAH